MVDKRELLEAYEEAVEVVQSWMAVALDNTVFAAEDRNLKGNRHDRRRAYRKARHPCGGGHHHGHDHETSRACTIRCAHDFVDLCPDHDHRFHDESDLDFYQIGARHGLVAENVDRHGTKDGERQVTTAFSKWHRYM